MHSFFGPTIGPIIGGFVGESIGWRWILGIMAISTSVFLVIYFVSVPETYAPVILQRRAKVLTAATGHTYKSQATIKQGEKTLKQVFKTSLSRPWILLVREPIITILSIYQALIYATLYMCFGKRIAVTFLPAKHTLLTSLLKLHFQSCFRKREVGLLASAASLSSASQSA